MSQHRICSGSFSCFPLIKPGSGIHWSFDKTEHQEDVKNDSFKPIPWRIHDPNKW